jgi:hypothetical protein
MFLQKLISNKFIMTSQRGNTMDAAKCDQHGKCYHLVNVIHFLRSPKPVWPFNSVPTKEYVRFM